MSLTSLLETNPDIRDRFRSEFKTPPLGRKDAICAVPVTRNYALVGTAFDYYLRFRVKRLNPQAVGTRWVAEEASLVLTCNCPTNSEKEGQCDRIIGQARRNLKYYLSGHNNDTALIVSCLELATLDSVFRSGGRGVDMIGIVDQGDVVDMTLLASLIDDTAFTTKEACFLNPTFGKASVLVGGADADLLIGDTLLEIKTVKDLTLKTEYFQQLMGYYCLSRIGRKLDIRNVGIYFSRHGVLWTAPVEKIIDKSTFPALLVWFKKRANEETE